MTEKCPYAVVKRAGDESYTLCELTLRPSGRIQGCVLEGGYDCEEYNEWLKEEEDERKDNQAK